MPNQPPGIFLFTVSSLPLCGFIAGNQMERMLSQHFTFRDEKNQRLESSVLEVRVRFFNIIFKIYHVKYGPNLTF